MIIMILYNDGWVRLVSKALKIMHFLTHWNPTMSIAASPDEHMMVVKEETQLYTTFVSSFRTKIKKKTSNY